MSRHEFRFVHATRLMLDEPLVGTGTLSSDARQLVERATLLAWDAIVSTCISNQVDFLLLTGNCFQEHSQSLRARVALQRGFEKLDAHHIDVFVVPGDADPPEAWRVFKQLPPNVAILDDERQEPIAIVRHGTALASLMVIASARTDESNWNGTGPAVFQRSAGSYCIGVLPAGTPLVWEEGHPHPVQNLGSSHGAATLARTAIEQGVNYIACGAGFPQTTRLRNSLIHDPGPSQSLSKAVSGSCGCSLIDVDTHGATKIDDVAVAPVRWENMTVDIDRHSNWNDLIERMALMVMDRVADNDEQLWIMNWRFEGEGRVFDALSEADRESELWELLEAELEGESDVQRVHRVERITRQILDPENAEDSTGLLEQFEVLLRDDGGSLVEFVRQQLLEESWLNRNESQLVRRSIAQADQHTIVDEAIGTISNWLS